EHAPYLASFGSRLGSGGHARDGATPSPRCHASLSSDAPASGGHALRASPHTGRDYPVSALACAYRRPFRGLLARLNEWIVSYSDYAVTKIFSHFPPSPAVCAVTILGACNGHTGGASTIRAHVILNMNTVRAQTPSWQGSSQACTAFAAKRVWSSPVVIRRAISQMRWPMSIWASWMRGTDWDGIQTAISATSASAPGSPPGTLCDILEREDSLPSSPRRTEWSKKGVPCRTTT